MFLTSLYCRNIASYIHIYTNTLILAKALEKLPATCIKFGLGVPNVNTFPFKVINIELTTGEKMVIENEELSSALQYLPSIG